MPMEVLVITVGFILLALLALRYGYDSRSNFQSKEQELASFGMVWDVAELRALDLRREAAAARYVAELNGSRRTARRLRKSTWVRVVRRSAARALRATAAWLSPELTDAQRLPANGKA